MPHTEASVADRYGLVFFLSVFWSFQSTFISVGSCTEERPALLINPRGVR